MRTPAEYGPPAALAQRRRRRRDRPLQQDHRSDRHRPVTQDMVTTILADEEGHRHQFVGFLREYE
ncbi:MAG: hypothetical protein QM679_09160 [Patulibacter sp.]